ncbi:hypothetical protein [Pseudomonas phage vB_PaeM_PAO1_Ab17]|uniref:Uncharacterized protein n=2 Tax=Nankokuvirus Ab03 TaxID=1925780 RepID=A0A0A1IVQ0_9CAUD|nr:hypothetical protein VC54_gp120 [Pseudomonas phage vB_PaeM_PAO1_Ab03]CEF89196.1 hypothetical protein [Pseudomonas phage vB_PaeM_PAO1_Ab03]CEF89580.1 hypothetical protein [Pseudomonas phage vB_PaeM_PAO1_Ab17]
MKNSTAALGLACALATMITLPSTYPATLNSREWEVEVPAQEESTDKKKAKKKKLKALQAEAVKSRKGGKK